MEKEIFNTVIDLRHCLHSNAELSGKEIKTMKILKNFIEKNTSFKIFHNANDPYFFASLVNGKNLPTIAFRADMDAIPINENDNLSYKSKNKGISHKCGHDGHCATLAALALMLEKQPIKNKNIIILFQHSEEIGAGAKEICNANFIKNNNVSSIYSFHNIPGHEKGEILVYPEVFACASKGMKIKLIGKPSHAAYPEKGVNPSNAISEIVKFLNSLHIINSFKGMVLSTIVYIFAGEKAFGTSAANGELWITLRAENEDELLLAQEQIESFVQQNSLDNNLAFSISYSDEFPETRNSSEYSNNILNVATSLSIKTKILSNPNRWSEDFGYYLKETKGAMFGIGAGKKHPQLHTENYDFPDEIIKIGANIMYKLLEK
ncbi:amidohydrolase [Clostridium sp. DL1XJH146]